MDKKDNFIVYISSPYEDLKEYRKAVMETLLRMGKGIKAMEFFGSKPDTPKVESLRNLRKCNVFIGFYGMRYGTVDPETGKSYSQLEYEEAQKRGIPPLIYLIDEENQPVLPKYVDTGTEAQKLIKFKQHLHKKHTVSPFTTPDNLSKRISQDLLELLEDIGADINKDNIKLSQSFYEYQKIHTEIEEAYEELKELDTIRSNIIANVSHELRTPGIIIKGALGLIGGEKDKKTQEEYINLAMDALQRQDSIIGDLIAASKMTSTENLELTSVDIAQLVILLKGKFKPKADKYNLQINLKIEKNLPRVIADFNQLRHALRNLIDNAIKFNKKGGEITIEACKKRDMIEVCVIDTGIGIPKDKQEKIFERLYQVDASTSRSFEGTGMGLTIAKEIVEAHGGIIWAESTIGVGTTIFFTLPIMEDS